MNLLSSMRDFRTRFAQMSNQLNDGDESGIEIDSEDKNEDEFGMDFTSTSSYSTKPKRKFNYKVM